MPGRRVWLWKLENGVVRAESSKEHSGCSVQNGMEGQDRGQGHQARCHCSPRVNAVALWVAVARGDSRDVRTLGGIRSSKLGDRPEETGKAAGVTLVSDSSGRTVVARIAGIVVEK